MNITISYLLSLCDTLLIQQLTFENSQCAVTDILKLKH